MKTGIKIIEEYLDGNGYDGLYLPGECACKKDDLMPCGGMDSGCKPGYLQAPEGDDDEYFTIGPEKHESSAPAKTA